ncbi:type VII secretion integral membrane protein EccD [Streptosporangium lutulentum]|uniref:Type VII secretion integral membrane protein EccD n=1 Tax=Streptosporangium lutulentum TaxID=1461250 RepID=A0ABT9QRL4_9ACTN|nr:type VII secretion integral membrane protein EccD [Streptosporangium lutulentum]MDP9849382.1 type VII secretion integral membrane protein EccD [Streptosporangium lutulentum]
MVRSLAQPPSQGPGPQGALAQVALPLSPLCHVTIVGPRRKADLTVPADIPLPHVMPSLLRAMGEVGGDFASGPGWVLQRIGGPPLDLGQSLGSLGVLDGEVLHLRPSEVMLPPVLFDDVADVVATEVEEGSSKWTPKHTRLLGMNAAVMLLVTGVVILATVGPPWTVPAVLSGVLAVLLLVAGAALSRAVGDSGAGTLIGYVALPYGFLAGLLIPASDESVFGLGAPHLLSGFAFTAFVATVGVIAIADGVPGFLGTAVASTVGAVCAASVMVFEAPPAGVAALAVTILLAFSPLIPTLSFRLARVPMPSMPVNAEELRADNQRIDSSSIRERAAYAQRYVTGLVAGMGMVTLGTQAYLVRDSGWVTTAIQLTLSLTLILRVRVFHGFGQRLWLMIAGIAGIVMFAISQAVDSGGVVAIAVVVGLLWVAAIPVGMGLWLPKGKPSPFWGRAGDIVEALLIVTLFPLALGVLGVYTWMRGLAG